MKRMQSSFHRKALLPCLGVVVLLFGSLHGATPGLAAANWTIVGWNNLGMHCMDSDFSFFAILPPYNTIHAQLIDASGHLVTDGAGITVTYEAIADPDGSINTTYQYTANAYGATFNSIAEAQIQMINQIGIKTTTVTQDYNSVYKTQTFAGNFKGMAFGYETPFPEAGGYASAYLPGNANNHSKIDDPKLTDLWKKQGAELDLTKRKDLFNQIQQYHATKMYYIPSQAGAGTGWGGWREWVQTNDIHSVPGSYGWPTELLPWFWKTQ